MLHSLAFCATGLSHVLPKYDAQRSCVGVGHTSHFMDGRNRQDDLLHFLEQVPGSGVEPRSV